MRSRHRTTAVVCVALAALLVMAGTASARTVQLYSYTGNFLDGFGSTAGTFKEVDAVAIHQSDGRIYTADRGRLEGSFSQFTLTGEPIAFPTRLGASSASIHSDRETHIAVDNSNASSTGNIYVGIGGAKNTVRGFSQDGTELGSPFPLGGFQSSCGLAVDPQGNLWVAASEANKLIQFTSVGTATGKTVSTPEPCQLAIDSQGNFYVTAGYTWHGNYTLRKYDSSGNFVDNVNAVTTRGVAVDRSTDNVFAVESDNSGTHVTEYNSSGDPLTTFGYNDPEHSYSGLEDSEPMGVAVNEATHEVYLTSPRIYSGRQHVDSFAPTSEVVVPTVTTENPDLTPTQATLKGTVDLDGGGDTTDCHFDWGTTANYGNSLPCNPPSPITAEGVQQVTAELTGLVQGTIYHYRLSAKNADNVVAHGADQLFRPQGQAIISNEIVGEVNTDGARIGAEIDPNGGDTTYRVEYGSDECATSACASAPLPHGYLPNPLGAQQVSVVLIGLGAGATYHYRVVAENAFGETDGADQVFTTYSVEPAADPCPNALIRKQTGGVLLPDCRAYELVSAANAGGYDVTSDLVAGQVPFTASPQAKDSVLYSLNYGMIPGVSGEPTNQGNDPYVATRTEVGWKTRYSGISVGEPPLQGPFGSTPTAESADLSTFAFGGPSICMPCFSNGKTGIPVRRLNGSLTQGMAGSLDPGPAAAPDGYIGQQISADGTHVIFGSTAKFEPDGNGNGDVSVYDHNLVTGITYVVSKAPNGGNLACLGGAGTCHSPGNGDGIASLGVSDNGARIVVAQRISTDAAGNHYWHPYLNVGDSSHTVDLAPGTTTGVTYDGMSSDGSAVFFTTKDQLTADDHDSSADIYRAAVAQDGTLQLNRVSTGTGGTGDTDACDPMPGSAGNNWNAVGVASPNSCGAVAFAGGAGVATEDGSIYFLSPELLDGSSSGTQDQPNLYVASAGGAPHFVATLESTNSAIRDGVEASDINTFSDIQVTPNGSFAAFSSNRSLTGHPTFGHYSIYRYSRSADELSCASCPLTGAGSTDDTKLSRFGLNLSDDGRVFFTTTEPLVLRDTGGMADVYEWNKGKIGLLSTGRSASDAGLLSVSADGVNAYFFTRDALVQQDRNGEMMKIYDAREGGGFEVHPSTVPCQASDECHGPGSQAPSSGAVGTFEGTGGNYVVPKTAKRHRHRPAKRRHRGRHGHRTVGTTARNR